MGGLPLIHLPADDALRILDRDAPLGTLDMDDEADDHDHEGGEQDDLERAQLARR